MFAFVTVWPSHAEWRIVNDQTESVMSGSEPLGDESESHRLMGLGKIMNTLIHNKVDNIQIRFENWED